MSEDRRPLKSRSFGWVQSLARKLAERGMQPNSISTAGIGFAAIGFVAMWGAGRGWPFAWFFLLLAAVAIQGRLLCNLLDGLVAIEWDRKQKGGELYNEVPDRVEDTLFLVGAGYAAGEIQLGWLCAVLAVFTAYVRMAGAALAQGHDFGGPCAKQHRMFILTVGLIGAIVAHFAQAALFNNDPAADVLKTALAMIAAGTLLTAALRLRRLYQKLP
jgi:phosphatidylglycerophosphate synthase